MKYLSYSAAIAFLLALTAIAPAQEKKKVAPVRMGSGIMTFDTVPGWGLRPDGQSAIGPTHGSVVVDKAGNIYTSSDAGVFVFSPEGKVIQSYLEHGIVIHVNREIRVLVQHSIDFRHVIYKQQTSIEK